MSLKSFDKFCENMILGEPKNEKDIFDERQNQLRSKLTLEAFQLYALLSFVGLIIYEAGYAYCESVIALLAFFGAVSYMWWVLRNLHFGSLIGVKYANTLNTASVMCAEMLVFGFIMYDNFNEDRKVGESFFINNGQLSEYFVIVIAMAMILISSVVVFVAVSRHKKEEVSDE